MCEQPNDFKYVYEEQAPLWDKMKAIATRIYGASEVTADSKVRARIRQLQDAGYEDFLDSLGLAFLGA